MKRRSFLGALCGLFVSPVLPKPKDDLVIVDEAALIPLALEDTFRKMWHLPARPSIDSDGMQMIDDLQRLEGEFYRTAILNPEARVWIER